MKFSKAELIAALTEADAHNYFVTSTGFSHVSRPDIKISECRTCSVATLIKKVVPPQTSAVRVLYLCEAITEDSYVTGWYFYEEAVAAEQWFNALSIIYESGSERRGGLEEAIELINSDFPEFVEIDLGHLLDPLP